MAKVCRAPTDERHLLVRIGNGGLPDPVCMAIMGVMLEALPKAAPTMPEQLTHLWLTTGWSGSPLIRWSKAGRWTARPLAD